MKKRITHSPEETQRVAGEFAQILRGGDIVCLQGDLGSGKTTFTQGLLAYFQAEKPYNSPTFLIMKMYGLTQPINNIHHIYHIDAYRITSQDILVLDWKDIIEDPQALTIIEWPEHIKDIIPDYARHLQFFYTDKEERCLTFPA